MKFQMQQKVGVKVSVQPYPYVKGKKGVRSGRNKSVTLLDCDTPEVFGFLLACFRRFDDIVPLLEEWGESLDLEGADSEDTDSEDDE